MRVQKLPTLGLPQLWGPITSYADFWLWWGLKQSCSPCWELSNGMLHATWTQGNRVDSLLLVVGSQIANLTPSPSFGHNLCFRCPHGSCEPNLDIYIPRNFLWNKEFFKHWVLTPVIALWRFGSPLGLHLPKWELPWECEGSFPHTFLHSWEHAVWFSGFLLARNLASPFRPGREPKAKVATFCVLPKIYSRMIKD
jgi:hypothetical protein